MGLKNCSLKLSLVLSLILGITGLSLPLTPTLAIPTLLAQSPYATTLESYSKLPLNFELNQGQTDAQVKFMAQGRGYNLFLTSTEVVLALQKPAASKDEDWARLPLKTVVENTPASEPAVLRMKLIGANPMPKVIGLEDLPGKVNYFIGNNPAKWRTHIPTYGKVQYASVYPGVDLVYYGTERQLEYDFIVAPGADPTSIQLAFAGADQLEVNDKGDLVLHIASEQLLMHKPVIYQAMAGVRQEIAGGFVRRGKDQVAFQIGAYDAARPLVIDPVLTYASYLGGTGQDFGNGVATDSNGYVYVVGYTDSDQASFPVTGGPDLTYNSGQDVFVTKLTADGAQVVYSGYIGGGGQEFGMNIAVDGAGNAYIVGYTNSNESTFPVTIGPDLSYNGGQDAFVAKLSTDGSHLLYAGYIGGTGNDFGNGIAVDAGGNSYIVGTTNSTEVSFPVTVGPDLLFNGPGEGYVAKVNTDGTALLYAGYIGGSGDEAINAVALDPDCAAACQAYVAGSSASDQTTFPVVGGPDLTYNGGTDAFVAKIKGDGTGLDYAGYIGGSGADYLYSIAVDSGGNAYVYGNTDSTEATFPVSVGPGLTYKGGRYDAFIAKLNTTGTALIYTGYIGGAGDEFGRGIAVDDAGNAYVSGWTSSTEATFSVSGGPDLTYNGGPSDVFVAKVNAAGTALDYAGYIGGSSEETTGHANPIAVDRAGNSSYIIGATSSNEATFPVTVGPDLTFNGAYDSFVAKVVNTTDPTAYCPEWNLAIDFRVSPNQENPNRDSCGNLNVWHFLESDPNTYPAHLPTGYTPLPEFINDFLSFTGLEQWQGGFVAINDKSKLPSLGINTTGVTQYVLGIIWPPGMIGFHPLNNTHTIVGWRSPINGTVMVEGGVNDLDNSCGDGISWFIDHGDGLTNTTLASGSIPEGGSQNFSNGVNGASLASILVKQGDFLYFIGDPSGNLYCDSTGLSLTIRSVSTATPTNTPVPPTYTPTNTPVPTNTLTFTPTPTDTPTVTLTPTSTSVTPTDTPTFTPTPTNTLAPSTNTATSTVTNTPTLTPTPTGTPVPLTPAPPTPTPCFPVACTPTPTPTNTPAPPTPTPTNQALFTDIGVSVTEIQFEPAIGVPGQPVTIKAKVQNLGLSDAADIRIDFIDFGTLLQQTTITSLPVGTATEVTFETTYAEAGLRLISIRVDPDNVIAERSEDNNEATKVLQVGQPDLSQATIVIQASSVTTCQRQVVAISGQAYYDFNQVPGTNDYPVQGGRVTVTLLDPATNSPIGVFTGAHTEVNGQFSQAVIAPVSDGAYPVRVEVTDQTLTREIHTTLTVSGPCPGSTPSPTPTGPTPAPTPSPSPTPTGPTPIPSPTPTNGPPVREVYVSAEDIYFTNNHPAPGETIQIFASIHYYGTESTPAIPVTLYDVLPVNGVLAKVVIGAAQVSFQGGTSSQFNVSVPWTANLAGAHVIQVVVEPPFDQFTQNDKATRLILVGDVSQLEIQKILALLLDADGDGKISPGDRLQYTISYRNNGAGEATNAVIIDDYDEGLLAPPTQISQGGAVGNGVITWQLGTLAAGASGSVTYQVDILPAAQFPPGHTKIGNIALLTADQAPSVADSVEVEVRVNRAPMVGVELSLVTKNEGETAANRGTVSDADGDAVTLSASVGTVTNNGNGTWSWSFTTSDGPPQSQTVTITADDGNGTSQTSFSLTVNNVAPTVGDISAPVNPQPVGTTINTSASFNDPGTGDTHTATWDWEGVTSAGTVNETNGAGTVSGSHTYATAGIYTIKVIVTDDDGGSGQSLFQYGVIYDPNGGFVTGGGWIDSPAGAYPADPTLTGKATFGFVAKYKKGATVPTGQTEFQFQVANLNFHSENYAWLVVAGANAKFKGTGTINGVGNYGFMLTAADGQINGGGGNDKFRIKIWDKNNGDAIVYDNQMGQPDDSNVGTALSGGSIAIKDSKAVTSATVSEEASAVEGQTHVFLPLIKR